MLLIDPNGNESLTVKLTNLTVTNGKTTSSSADGSNGGGLVLVSVQTGPSVDQRGKQWSKSPSNIGSY